MMHHFTVLESPGLSITSTSQMIYHCGGEHCWCNVMAHKPLITAQVVTVYCSGMSVVSNTNDTLKLWAKFLAFVGVNYVWLTWSELNYCVWFVLSVSSLSLSVMVRSCHACVNLSRLHSSGFMPTLRSRSSPGWHKFTPFETVTS